MKIDKDDVKQGDVVWHDRYGYGTVTRVQNGTCDVKFNGSERILTFTEGGYSGDYKVLWWQPPIAFHPRKRVDYTYFLQIVDGVHIRQSCQTLARDSWLLKRTAYIDVQAGVKDYYIESGDNEQVYLIHGINLGKGRCWTGCSTNCFVPLKGCRNEAFTFEPSDKIILSRIPKEDKENQLKVDYLAMPTQNACQVDKLLYDRYHDVVVNGALSNLLFMRQYEFADPQMAMVYEKRLKQGIAQAKIDTMRAFETGVQTLTSGAWI